MKATTELQAQDEVRDWILKVADVSSTLRSPLTTEEISNYFLPKIRLSPLEVEQIVSNDPELSKQLTVERTFLVRYGQQRQIDERLAKKESAAEKIREASRFAKLASRLSPNIRTIAVSGSAAYQSSSTQDDVDLFIVTKPHRLWITIFLVLLLFRVFRLRRLWVGRGSLFCLSYVHDELGFAREARGKRTALFGRELLMAIPLAGLDYYRRIIESNTWISEYYPEAYSKYLRNTVGARAEPNGVSIVRNRVGLAGLADSFAYVLVGTYLKLRAYLQNMHFASAGNASRIFEAQISRGSCIYSSNFYVWLQSLWGFQ